MPVHINLLHAPERNNAGSSILGCCPDRNNGKIQYVQSLSGQNNGKIQYVQFLSGQNMLRIVYMQIKKSVLKYNKAVERKGRDLA